MISTVHCLLCVVHICAEYALINHLCGCPLCQGPEQQRLDEAAALPGVSDHQSGQHGA